MSPVRRRGEEARDWAMQYLGEKWDSIDNHYHFSDGHLAG